MRQAAFGLQHVLIMYTGCITVPLVFGAAVGLDKSTVALLISADLLIAGIITMIQSLGGVGKLAGARLPIVCGATFAGLTPMILIAKEYGLQAVYGSMLAGGLVGLALAVPFARLIRFFPPLVTGGVVLTVVGISLIGVAAGLIVGNDPTADTFADPGNIMLAGVVVLVAIAFLCLGRGSGPSSACSSPRDRHARRGSDGLIDLGGVSGSPGSASPLRSTSGHRSSRSRRWWR